MSTVWRGICLSHDPHIEFDLIVDGHEIHDAQTAVDLLRADPHGHPSCDLVVGGFSYPLIAAACVCGLGSKRVIDVTTLRVINQALKLEASWAPMLNTAVSEWTRRNPCWTKEKLSRLLETE